MSSLYPLKFHPRLVEKIWGGRKFETILGRPLPPGQRVGESWELYDFPPGVVDKSDAWVSATVANGPLAGRTLHELVGQFGRDLHGDVPLTGPHGQFPILIKYLDAREDLSLQVHPDQAYAAAHPDAHLKSEAWYVLQSEPDSAIYRGLRPGTTREQFQSSLAAGTAMDHVVAHPAKPGHCFYLPSGTAHALGAGILVAEVQTPSDTTFRVFDFNRVDASTGKPRTLHVEQAMDCIDFDCKEESPRRDEVGGPHASITRLVTSPYFTLEKVRFAAGVEEPLPHKRPVVWMVLEGRGEIRVAGMNEPSTFGKGETVLLPAAMESPVLKTLADCVWLEVTFPNVKES